MGFREVLDSYFIFCLWLVSFRPTGIALLDAFNVISPNVSAPKTSDTDQASPVASAKSLTTAMASSLVEASFV